MSIKLVFILAAIFFGVWSIGVLIAYIIDLASYAKLRINEVAYPLMMTKALQGLSPSAIGLASQYGAVEALGIMADKTLDITFRLRCEPVDVDWKFAREFIRRSEEYYPNLMPIGAANEILDEHGNAYINNERMAQALTNRLITAGAARPGRGNQSAVALIPYEDIAVKFGLIDEKGRRL